MNFTEVQSLTPSFMSITVWVHILFIVFKVFLIIHLSKKKKIKSNFRSNVIRVFDVLHLLNYQSQCYKNKLKTLDYRRTVTRSN